MKMKKSLIIPLIIVSVILIVGVSLYRYAIESPWYISAAEAKRRIVEKKVDLILDVRTPLERETLGFYPNSVHIPSGELNEETVGKAIHHKNARILVYCNTGQRARVATEKLHELGYKNAYYIAGPHTSIM